MKLEDLPAHRTRLRILLEQEGIRSSLAYLNSLTEHRFTALYRFSDETLKNCYFYDRLDPGAVTSADISIEASYCIFLKKTGRSFLTNDSLADERVASHPKRKEILSYCGVPLIDADGTMFGSVCHFDFEAKPISDSMVELMENLSTMIMELPQGIN